MKKILVILLLTSILGYLYFYEPKKDNEFRFLNQEDINWFSIVNKNSIFRVSKKDNTWQIDQPVITPASKKYIQKFKELISQSQNIKKIELENQDYGLNPPKLVLTLQSDSLREVYTFGDYNEITSLRYLQKEGDKNIYLISEEVFDFLNIDLLGLRARKPIDFEKKDLLSLVAIPFGIKPIIIKKDKTNKWRVNQSFFIDDNLFDKSLSKIKNSNVLNFIDNPNKDISKYGLDQPLLSLRLLVSKKNKNSEIIDLIFSKVQKSKILPASYYMKIAGVNTIYRVLKGSFHDWLKGVDFYRNRKILDSACLDLEQRDKKVKDLYALNIVSLDEFKSSKEGLKKDFICGKDKLRLEIGDSVKSNLADNKNAPIYVKVNNEFTAVISADDTSKLR